MAKTKSAWVCQSVGYESAKWLGKCPSCNSWNSFAEEVTVKGGSQSPGSPGSRQGSPGRINQPVRLSEIEFSPEYRIRTGAKEFDRVLGGGIVPGPLVLLGGEPGLGQSNLMLQEAMGSTLKGIYVSVVK